LTGPNRVAYVYGFAVSVSIDGVIILAVYDVIYYNLVLSEVSAPRVAGGDYYAVGYCGVGCAYGRRKVHALVVARFPTVAGHAIRRSNR
jgi:hypothetical protein